MDLKTLEEQADQLEARVNRNAADYTTLRDLAVVYHYYGTQGLKGYAKKAVQRLDEAYQKTTGR